MWNLPVQGVNLGSNWEKQGGKTHEQIWKSYLTSGETGGIYSG